MNKNKATQLVVQKLLVYNPPEPLNNQLQNLLQNANGGADITQATVDLLLPHGRILVWANHEINSLASATQTPFNPLAGLPNIPATQLWICPKQPCGEWFPVIIEDEDPPLCPKHRKQMVRWKKKR